MRTAVLKLASITAGLVALAAPLAAQATHADADPDHKVAGGGLPAGWSGRTDRPTQNLSDAKFVTMGSGYHVTSGPAAIYYRAANTATGNYTVHAKFTQSKAAMHPEAYGLIVGGKSLDQPTQSYLYFLVRQDGKYLIKHRAGDQVHTVADWTANPAVHSLAGSAPAVNDLRVKVGADSVRFLVNGTQVQALARGGMVDPNGVYGLRVNHNLDVHVDDFGMTKSK